MKKENIFKFFKSNEAKKIFKEYNLKSVVLFGSVITEEFHEYSDIDVAILSEGKIDINDSLDIELFLTKALNREIDLIDLFDKNLDIFVKINILNNGKVIYSSDNEESLEKVKEKTHYEYKENENFFYFRRKDVLG